MLNRKREINLVEDSNENLTIEAQKVVVVLEPSHEQSDDESGTPKTVTFLLGNSIGSTLDTKIQEGASSLTSS